MGIEKLNTFLVNLETVLGDIDKEKISIRSYRSGELAHIANRHSALYRLECDLGDIFESYLIQGVARFLDESAGKRTDLGHRLLGYRSGIHRYCRNGA